MAYGKIKADTLTWDNGGSDVDVTISTLPTAAQVAAKADLASPTFTGTPAAPTAAQGTNTTQVATTAYVQAEIGVSVQAYDADTTKNDVANTFTAEQTLNAGLSVDGPYEQAAETMAALDVDCSTGNYFKKSISTSSTITFSNIPSTGTAFSFVLELTLTGAATAITWPASVYWNSDAGQTAPTLTDARTHLFMFTTSDGGTTVRGAALVDYTA